MRVSTLAFNVTAINRLHLQQQLKKKLFNGTDIKILRVRIESESTRKELGFQFRLTVTGTAIKIEYETSHLRVSSSGFTTTALKGFYLRVSNLGPVPVEEETSHFTGFQ